MPTSIPLPTIARLEVSCPQDSLGQTGWLSLPFLVESPSLTEKCWSEVSQAWSLKCQIDSKEMYSAIKKNGIMPYAATWMDLEIVILSEVSQKEKNNRKMYASTHVWKLKKWY